MNYRNRELNELYQKAEILKQKTQDLFRRATRLHDQSVQEVKKLELEQQQAKSKSLKDWSFSKETPQSSDGNTKRGGKFFAGGTRTPSMEELLEAFNNPSQQKELFAELQFELDQQRNNNQV